MIFVTVGSQVHFNRLVKAVDQWAFEYKRDDVFAQIGTTDYRPKNIDWTNFLKPDEFERRYREASAIVAHAGTGSIITALQLKKPILIMPRQSSLGETRSDHQIATAKQFLRFESVDVAWDESELIAKLNGIDKLCASESIGSSASSELITSIRTFIESTP